MLKVGITGGIGSGKSVVCQVFTTLGIPVFRADDAARYLMEHDVALMDKIKVLFGADIYTNDKLDRPKLSGIVFKDPAKLQELNGLVHPATIAYGLQWMENQKNAPYTIKEAAIFFESGSNKDMDVMIGVYAPKELRVKRAMLRAGVSEQDILDRMAQQMDEEKKMKLCDYVIVNDDVQAVLPQILQLHHQLLKRAGSAV